MSVEFVDTTVLIYAHDSGAGEKHDRAVQLLSRLFDERTGALSVQVLAEFYAAATRKLGMKSQEVENVIVDLGGWTTYRPGHADVLRAIHLHRRHKLSWWDALIISSAIELGCRVLWSEDFITGRNTAV